MSTTGQDGPPAWQPALFSDPAAFDRARLAAGVQRLAAERVFIGMSSWKYEGWLGQVYTRERYTERGRFSRKLFEASCLREYAETFPIVCGDFSFYQFPSEAYWQRLFRSAAPSLLYAFKVPEQITVKQFPAHARYGANSGRENPTFLNAELLQEAFLGMLEPYRSQVGVLIFEFGAFSRRSYEKRGDFLADLDKFLGALPKAFPYSVEVRNPELLGPDYFSCLRSHRAAHVFNAWTKMPELPHQVRIADAYTADFTVTRGLLRKGRAYEEAVHKFSPYASVQEPYPEARQAIRDIIRRARDVKQPAFIFVNNRLEGNAPGTVQAILDE
jgi:uncharacterized protein YecE (DUF72 family)